MFAFKFATILAVVATAAVAIPTPAATDSCQTGTLQCCDSVASDASQNSALLGGLLPLNTQDTSTPLGFNCIPLSVTGAGSAGTCNTQTACCDGVNNEGLVPIGVNCSPINIGL